MRNRKTPEEDKFRKLLGMDTAVKVIAFLLEGQSKEQIIELFYGERQIVDGGILFLKCSKWIEYD